MKKYVVVCYAIHNECIDSHEPYYDLQHAKDCLVHEANEAYQTALDSINKTEETVEEYEVSFNIIEDEFAHLVIDEGEYEWTWEIIVV